MKLRFWQVVVDLCFVVALVYWFGWYAALIAAIWNVLGLSDGLRKGARK